MKKIAIILFAIFSTLSMHAQMLAVSTDAVQDVMLMPNVGFDLVVGQHSTLGVSYTYGKNSWVPGIKQFQMIQPEYRHFFSGRPMFHHFVGISAIGADYNVSRDEKRYEGDAIGLGITFGYVLKLNDRLNIDFHAGAGLVGYWQKEYSQDETKRDMYLPNGEYYINARGIATIPTKIGISVTYILNNYKKIK